MRTTVCARGNSLCRPCGRAEVFHTFDDTSVFSRSNPGIIYLPMEYTSPYIWARDTRLPKRRCNLPKGINQPSKIATDTAGAAANPVGAGAPSNEGTGYEEVRRLAFEYWLARGCPDGSSEEDWFRAEQALQGAAKTEQ